MMGQRYACICGEIHYDTCEGKCMACVRPYCEKETEYIYKCCECGV